VEPARTVAAFHSPFDKARFTAPMSDRSIGLRSGSVTKLSSEVPGAGDSSRHCARALRISTRGFL